ncbi:hypothetical protein HYFRA_00001473 [Hymenoscyphus fraxineus]|uniref:ribonuclease H n=1 Tax=Hymenoscyphus fraxineus TaxID=746836 RepID=A0A9N9PTV8_9HELO|nr:hypothetical protein HYFRA_00001473 [Hymenoscyphus fraxineus]
MVYLIVAEIDGGCRGNNSKVQERIGAAGVVFRHRWGRKTEYSKFLPAAQDDEPKVTSNRAELEAVILALQKSIRKYERLRDPKPKVVVKISADSNYVVNCLRTWIIKWQENGFIKSNGKPVPNQDLIKQAVRLDKELQGYDTVKVKLRKVPREENTDADGLCNRVMDKNSGSKRN